MKLSTTIVTALAMLFIFASGGFSGVEAQPTPLPQMSHPRRTQMGIRAHELQRRLAGRIAKEKSKGADVSAAEKHKAEGDAALTAGHYRIAVQHYEEGERSLPKE